LPFTVEGSERPRFTSSSVSVSRGCRDRLRNRQQRGVEPSTHRAAKPARRGLARPLRCGGDMRTSLFVALIAAFATPAFAGPPDSAVAQTEFDDEPPPVAVAPAAAPSCPCTAPAAAPGCACAAPSPAVLAPVKLEPPSLALKPPRDMRHDLGVAAGTFLGITVANTVVAAIGLGFLAGPGFGCGEEFCGSSIAGFFMSTIAGAGAIGGLIATVALYAVRARYHELPRVIAGGRGSSLSFSF
jgi:hypothetical protein